MILVSAKDFQSCLVHFLKIVTSPLSFLDLPPLCNVAQIVKILLINKNENTDAVFCICVEHKSKARNRNVGFKSAR